MKIQEKGVVVSNIEAARNLHFLDINIEQNEIVKIFSVAAVIFMPATLVASMYGMNFKFMPELEWEYGYIWAIALMLIVSGVTYWFFKFMKWL